MTPVTVTRGQGPIVLALPHSGTHVPDEIFARLTPLGQTLGDADWHVDRLYDGLLDGVTTVRANFHRYVIDANRDPSGASLYPGQNTTGLVPMTNFDGEPLWLEEPDADEIEARRIAWHAPYHAALEAELQRVRDQHGVAILYDCHSIRSVIPFLFTGRLPDFNIGTNNGATCAADIETAAADICARAEGYTSVVNGRFKGGWTTRHYGRPADNIHAIQMELAQRTHLQSETVPFDYDPAKAGRLRIHLETVLRSLAGIAASLGGQK
ncbi:N-formylglutamate deformylase [uncultured Hoeflea sp.]|uniref:N-formylglutamate deformylase n=1 Tax=uncultured Hoeflea sp. TaxID=538666 RepID=UPI00262DF812|nr:N-formylglutamate deformylase [uncultured Hoeflea sp.]